jgi:hypothetical protein
MPPGTSAAPSGTRSASGLDSNGLIPNPITPISSDRIPFCSASGNVRPTAMTSPIAFICGTQRAVRAGELGKIPARYLHDHIIQRRLEARWSHSGDVIRNFVEREAHRQQRRDLGNRKAGRFARQRRWTAKRGGSSRSHRLAHRRGLIAKLHVRAACRQPDAIQHNPRHIAQPLQFFICQSFAPAQR